MTDVRREHGQLGKLNLDPALVAQARELARRAGAPVVKLARTHTTVSVERAVLRLAGLDGADEDGMPWVNRLTERGPRDDGPGARGGPARLGRHADRRLP